MNGHTLSAITASPRVGGAVIPRWMDKVGADCECGTVIVGKDAIEVMHSHSRHLFAVRREVERSHYPMEWTDGRMVCARCMPLADWPCPPVAEVRG